MLQFCALEYNRTVFCCFSMARVNARNCYERRAKERKIVVAVAEFSSKCVQNTFI